MEYWKQRNLMFCAVLGTVSSLGGQEKAYYYAGEPGDSEQLFVELINRARADAVAEGQRLVETTDPDVELLRTVSGIQAEDIETAFADLPTSLPPLAINGILGDIAESHSMDMFTNDFEGSEGSDGLLPEERAFAAGYSVASFAENVYAIGQSVWSTHWWFQVSESTRSNIHSSLAKEIGVGIVEVTHSDGENAVGPLVVTQDYGSRTGGLPMVTGVVYWDADGDGFYDEGEGLGGVLVEVAGERHYTTTAASGGYAVPVESGDGVYTVRMVGPGLAETTEQVTISEGENVKVDRVETAEPTALMAALSDTDGDGMVDFLGSALGGEAPKVERGAGTLRMRYTAARDDVVYRVLRNTDLGPAGWRENGVTQSPDPASASVGSEIVAEVAIPEGGPIFLRLEVYPE